MSSRKRQHVIDFCACVKIDKQTKRISLNIFLFVCVWDKQMFEYDYEEVNR
jgi:hypothetical protein